MRKTLFESLVRRPFTENLPVPTIRRSHAWHWSSTTGAASAGPQPVHPTRRFGLVQRL